jgi:hypothetical protein
LWNGSSAISSSHGLATFAWQQLLGSSCLAAVAWQHLIDQTLVDLP